ncbi:MAG: GWxTD domain-containing protein [Thermoanaerobaculales bacterium]|nr:GWxTD domain-containing protein [Thermoanaerobaculales bacterium]
MRRILLSLVIVFLTALPATAQLGEDHKAWAEGPVGFLLTEGEQQAWKTITDDDAARSFIDLFWAKRDPDLGTRENEFRQEYLARIEAADAEFAENDIRGALTNRGKTLLLLGVPAEHAHSGIGEYLAQLYRTGRPPQARSSDLEAHIQMQGVSFKLHQGRADLWGYTLDQLPSGIEWRRKADMVNFAFFDHEGSGIYRLQLGIRKSAESNAVLNATPEALLLHPEMQELPVFGLLPEFAPASSADLAWLESASRLDAAVVVFEPGIQGSGVATGWLSLRLPPETPIGDALIGRLSQGDEVLGTFRAPTEPLQGALGAMYEMTVPVPGGISVLEIALVNSDGPLHSERLEIELNSEAGTFLTQVFAGAQVDQRPDADSRQPFVFGGYHLAIRPDGRYRSGENLALFCLLTSPEGEAAPRPGSVRMRWYIDGKATPNQPSQPIQFAPAGAGTWVWGTQLPLGALGSDNEYELKISVRDANTDLSRTTKIPVLIIAE